uniref:Proteasome subunit beta type-3 n=1 Tax=Canis lupus familiaris TaxID=9615 RepID=A0A8C0S0S4_CANLF
MSIMSYNGGAVMAMKGKNCLAGLATDVQAVAQCLKFRLNLYELKEGQQIKPYTLMSMVANLLYEKRTQNTCLKTSHKPC